MIRGHGRISDGIRMMGAFSHDRGHSRRDIVVLQRSIQTFTTVSWAERSDSILTVAIGT